jgi:outer membrane protein
MLYAQQALPGVHANFGIAPLDRVIASYSALAALGRLNAQRYDLDAALYHREAHYDQVRDKGRGVDAPDGQ